MLKNIILCVTRFTCDTLEENNNYIKLKKFIGCIYGTPRKITDAISNDSIILVLEMNISKENKNITGIGLIKNYTNPNISCNIYKNNKYNKYIYYSKYKIYRDELTNEELILIKQLELILFKTKKHLQRSIGITKVPRDSIKNLTNNIHNKNYIYDKTVNKLLDIFNKKYNNIKL